MVNKEMESGHIPTSEEDPHLRCGSMRLHFLELLNCERVAILECHHLQRKDLHARLEGLYDTLSIPAHIIGGTPNQVRNDVLWLTFWTNNKECRIGDKMDMVGVSMQRALQKAPRIFKSNLRTLQEALRVAEGVLKTRRAPETSSANFNV